MPARSFRLLAVPLLAVPAATGLSRCHGAPHAAVVAGGLEFPAAFTIDPNGRDLWYTERLRPEDDGTIFVGHVNNGHIRRQTLDANRTSVSRDQLVIDHSGQVLAVESRPGGPVYFSDATAIYVLTMAG